MTQTSSSTENVNHYTTLGLSTPTPSTPISTTDIKSAYRRALLYHHPDKSSNGNCHATTDARNDRHSIDDITHARDTLLNLSLRLQHDRELLTSASKYLPGASYSSGEVALENIDLDDMTYNEASASWTRNCRCGNGRAFEIREVDLEAVVMEQELRHMITGKKEIVVGCGGCSLFVKVAFEVVDEGGGESV